MTNTTKLTPAQQRVMDNGGKIPAGMHPVNFRKVAAKLEEKGLLVRDREIVGFHYRVA